MSERLTINDGQNYRIEDGDREEWAGADIRGQLNVQGSVEFIDNPTTPGEEPFRVDEDGFTLPMSLNSLRMVTTGEGVIFIGLIATLGAMAATMKNYFGAALLMLAVFALVLGGTVGIGLEWFWALIALTVLAIAFGLVLRVMNDG